MPLDKVILDHVEDIESIEDEVADMIDKMIDKIDIDAVIADPHGSLNEFSNVVFGILTDKYYPMIADKGIEFAQSVQKDGDVQVSISKDPKLNEELLDRGENNG